jgi:hypothetical protein
MAWIETREGRLHLGFRFGISREFEPLAEPLLEPLACFGV